MTTFKQDLEKQFLEKELTQTVNLIKDLESENRSDMQNFSDGKLNALTYFKQSKKIIEQVKTRQKEIKKHEKKCVEIRQKLKRFN